MNYFIIVNDAQQGPFSVAELQQRGISSDTLVWTEGMAEWTPAWQVEELRPIFYKQAAATSVPPPPPVNPAAAAPTTDQPPLAAATDRSTKRSHRRRWLLLTLVVLLAMLAFTNPSEEKHRQVICDNITSGISKAVGGDSDDLLSQGLGLFSNIIGGSVVEMALNQSLEYHNYIFFSTTTLRVGKKDVPASTGFLGKVFTADEDQVAKGIEKGMMQGASDGDEADDTSAASDANSGQDVQVQRSERDTTFTDAAGRAIGRAVVRQVTKTVKQQVRENTDSATSSGIGKIIDEVEKLIGAQ